MQRNILCHYHPDHPVRDGGFTRLDLLVTVVCLGGAIWVATGTVSQHQTGSHSAVCIANLRDLSLAFQQYTIERDLFPPNPDDGNTVPLHAWVGGQAGIGGAQEFNLEILQDPSRSLLYPYLRERKAHVFRCPLDPRIGRGQSANSGERGLWVPAARSYAMNQAVGVDPYRPSNGNLPVHGPWLDNRHSHARGRKWRTYGRFQDVVSPSPERLAVFLDEDHYSINDGTLAFGMEAAEWIDRPATRHQMSGTIGFADGHVQMRRWVDPRTVIGNRSDSQRASVPDSADYLWLRERISAPIRP